MSSELTKEEIEAINQAELEKALKEFVPPTPEAIVFKFIYDPKSGYVTACTVHDTDQPFIVVTAEQYDAYKGKLWKLVDGKLVERKYMFPHEEPEGPPVVEGSTWKTTEDNMLIMGNDKGWDDRNNS